LLICAYRPSLHFCNVLLICAYRPPLHFCNIRTRYLHSVLSDGAITSTWIGVYDEMLSLSTFSSWNATYGMDPR
jgi:hypothetical protein